MGGRCVSIYLTTGETSLPIRHSGLCPCLSAIQTHTHTQRHLVGCIFSGTSSFYSLKKREKKKRERQRERKKKKKERINSGFFFLILKSKEPQADIMYRGPDKGSIATHRLRKQIMGVGGGRGGGAGRGGARGEQWRHFNIIPVSAQH